MIIFLLVISNSQTCLKTRCIDLQGQSCYKISEMIEVSSCPETKICNINQMYSTQTLNLQITEGNCVPQNFIYGSKSPGEFCDFNNECRTSNCDRGRCRGFGLGESCNYAEDCDVGMSCSSNRSGFCKFQVNPGEECDSFTDCDNGSGCFNGICRNYLTLTTGSKFFTNNAEVDPLLCSSGYLNKDLTCVSAPQNLSKPDKLCEQDSDCLLNNEEYGNCECGLNQSGNSYCKTAEGDEEYLNFLDSLRSLVVINQSCHTTLRFTQRCPQLQGTGQMMKYLRAYYIQLYRHLLIKAENCVIDLVNPLAHDYEYISDGKKTDDEDDFTLVIIIVSAIVGGVILLVLACWLCEKRCPVFLLRTETQLSIQTRDQALEIASTRLIRQSRGRSTSMFNIEQFQIIEDTIGALEIGIPIGVIVDEDSYVPREDEDFPLAQPEFQMGMQDMEGTSCNIIQSHNLQEK